MTAAYRAGGQLFEHGRRRRSPDGTPTEELSAQGGSWAWRRLTRSLGSNRGCRARAQSEASHSARLERLAPVRHVANVARPDRFRLDWTVVRRPADRDAHKDKTRSVARPPSCTLTEAPFGDDLAVSNRRGEIEPTRSRLLPESDSPRLGRSRCARRPRRACGAAT